jgi:hypothetical protein
MASSEETINLLEECLPFMEQRYLGCFYGEPWCFLTMYAAIMLLKLHVEKETPELARSSCARRFLDLYDRHIGRQQELIPIPHAPIYHEPADMTEVSDTFLVAMTRGGGFELFEQHEVFSPGAY